MRRVFMALLALALVLSMMSMAPVPTAEVGSNGQQIVLYVSGGGYPRISWVQIVGKNQFGQTVSKSFSYNPAADYAWMSGWWWKGTVNVTWRMSDGRSNVTILFRQVSRVTGSTSKLIEVLESVNWGRSLS